MGKERNLGAKKIIINDSQGFLVVVRKSPLSAYALSLFPGTERNHRKAWKFLTQDWPWCHARIDSRPTL